MYMAYWVSTGLSSPRDWRAASSVSGDAWGPTSMRAGSPGMTWDMQKVTMDTPINTRMRCISF